jgi:putative drug exporter of the RND superfamily
MERLGRFTVRRRHWILFAAVAGMVAAALFGGNVATHLSNGGFNDPSSESSRAAASLQRVFHSGTPNFVLLVSATGGTVDGAAVASTGRSLTRRLGAEPGVANVASYWSLGNAPALRSADGSKALILARITGSDDQVRDRVKQLAPAYTLSTPAATVAVGGRAQVFNQVGTQVERDLRRAEAISIPVTLLLLIVVFGSVIAAGLPLTIGIASILGTFLILRILASLTQVSIFSLNLTTALGLGLAIDYSLFILSRYREEVRGGMAPHDAVVRSVSTAGRTVAFSAVTVAISLGALLIFPLSFLRSFAYAGVAVVGFAALSALVVLPALLAALGRRVDMWTIWRRTPAAPGEGFWHRLATFVMRRPAVIAVSVVAVLLVLGAPFLRVNFGLPDDRVLPPTASSRHVQDSIRTGFASDELNTMPVVAFGVDPNGDATAVAMYATRLSALQGVAAVDAASGTYVAGRQVAPPGPASARFVSGGGAERDATWFAVVPSVEPYSNAGEDLVARIRALAPPFSVQVGGSAAELVDSKAGIFGRVPVAAALIGLVTFVVLFLMSGSLLVPAKAVLLNLLSLSATFGAMVWIFQQGHLSGTLGFTPTGMIDTTTPILMFCIAFGLSMDYEVFLLSRIKEEHDRTGDNTASVAMGLERTGRIVTAAAALLAVVFIAFATSEIAFIKLLGVGMALAVLMDATLIRGTLVPAFMRLAGRANWWAPAWLRRVHARIGISEAGGRRERRAAVAGPLPVGEFEA